MGATSTASGRLEVNLYDKTHLSKKKVECSKASTLYIPTFVSSFLIILTHSIDPRLLFVLLIVLLLFLVVWVQGHRCPYYPKRKREVYNVRCK